MNDEGTSVSPNIYIPVIQEVMDDQATLSTLVDASVTFQDVPIIVTHGFV